MKRSHGFTLLEILVVLAIIGVLLSIFGINYARSIQRAQFVEAQVAVSTALQRGRSLAQRNSADQPVTWTSTTLTIGGRTLTLPNGATITTTPAPGLAYTAPYGELTPTTTAPPDQLGQIFTLRSASGRFTADVAIVGVTGKVVRRQIITN